MARGHDDWSNRSCSLCLGLLPTEPPGWSGGPPAGMWRWCSWCFAATEHNLVQQRAMHRDTYECGACGRKTLPCGSCDEAMARGHQYFEDKQCFRCAELVHEWFDQETNLAAHTCELSCSWCFSHNVPHKLAQQNSLRRSTYTCTVCGMETAPCSSCDDGAARAAGAMIDGSCAACDDGVAWRTLAAAAAAVFSQPPLSAAELHEELSRPSAEKRAAMQVQKRLVTRRAIRVLCWS